MEGGKVEELSFTLTSIYLLYGIWALRLNSFSFCASQEKELCPMSFFLVRRCEGDLILLFRSTLASPCGKFAPCRSQELSKKSPHPSYLNRRRGPGLSLLL